MWLLTTILHSRAPISLKSGGCRLQESRKEVDFGLSLDVGRKVKDQSIYGDSMSRGCKERESMWFVTLMEGMELREI